MGWPAGLDLERLRPARMSQRPTSFSSDIMSRSLCKPSGSRLSLILPCNTTTPIYPQWKQTYPLSVFVSASLICLYTNTCCSIHLLQYFMLRFGADLGPCSWLWFESTGVHMFALRRLCSSGVFMPQCRDSAQSWVRIEYDKLAQVYKSTRTCRPCPNSCDCTATCHALFHLSN